jgi:hypothetical protein
MTMTRYRGQRYDRIVDSVPHIRRDGSATTLAVWQSYCVDCGLNSWRRPGGPGCGTRREGVKRIVSLALGRESPLVLLRLDRHHDVSGGEMDGIRSDIVRHLGIVWRWTVTTRVISNSRQT